MTRKSFIIHTDSLDVLDELTNEDAGKLFKAIKACHNGDDYKVCQLLRIALIPFKSQFTRDQEKYNNVCERNKLNGLKGGRPKNPVGLSETQKNPRKPRKPRKADSDSDSDNDSNKEKIELPENINVKIWDAFIHNRKMNKSPMTLHAKKILLTTIQKLVSSGDNANELLERAILNNWKSVYPSDEIKNQAKPKTVRF